MAKCNHPECEENRKLSLAIGKAVILAYTGKEDGLPPQTDREKAKFAAALMSASSALLVSMGLSREGGEHIAQLLLDCLEQDQKTAEKYKMHDADLEDIEYRVLH